MSKEQGECHRLMPALRLALANGVLRNESVTRRLLGYRDDYHGSRHFGRRLCVWADRGLLEVEPTPGSKRFTYRITPLGKRALVCDCGIVSRIDQPLARLRRYLEANPDEELGVRDVAVKFGISDRQARRVIGRVVDLGIAVRVNVVRLKPPPLRRAA